MYTKNDMITPLITARIFHDLVSPVGAIQNGLELLELTGIAPSEEFDLVKQSADSANATIAFLRVAFREGTAGADLTPSQINQLLQARYAEKRMEVVWDVEGEQTQEDVTLAFLMTMCFETAMPMGGQLTIRKSYPVWAFDMQSNAFDFKPETWQCLTGEQPFSGAPAMVHFEMARRQIEARGIVQDWSDLSGGHKFLLTFTKD